MYILILIFWSDYITDDLDDIAAALAPIQSVFKNVKEENWIAAWHSLNALCVYLEAFTDQYLCASTSFIYSLLKGLHLKWNCSLDEILTSYDSAER